MEQLSPNGMVRPRLLVSKSATIYEIAELIRALLIEASGEPLFAEHLARFEQGIGGKLERALAVLGNSAPQSTQFQLALCWLAANEMSPVLQLCWAKVRFQDLLHLKESRGVLVVGDA